MTIDQLLGYVFTGGLGALLLAAIAAYRERKAANVADRKQATDGTQTIAKSAETIAGAAANIVKMQNDEATESKNEIRALQAEVSALDTRLSKEIERRLRAEAVTESLTSQVDRLRESHADLKAQVNLAQSEIQKAHKENDELKGALFKMAVGATKLIRQLQDRGISPEYQLDVPFNTDADQRG